MNHAWRWRTGGLGVLALVLAAVNLAGNDATTPLPQATDQPAYQTEDSRTLVYDPQGALSYQLQARHVEYHSDTETTWFTRPLMTVYNQDQQPDWTVSANTARLTKDKQLYLQGDVQVTALAENAQLHQITSRDVLINLLTLDIESNERVTLAGPGLHSSGLKMRGNLRDKTARLLEQVKTSYEATHSQHSAH